MTTEHTSKGGCKLSEQEQAVREGISLEQHSERNDMPLEDIIAFEEVEFLINGEDFDNTNEEDLAELLAEQVFLGALFG